MVTRSAAPAQPSARPPVDAETSRPVREAVNVLSRLLKLIYPDPVSLDIITVDDILRRYPLTGLGAPALAAIEQSQRIVRARGDYSQVGLGEFHVGLIYLYWDDCRAAAGQFALARQPWSLVGDAPANNLAHYAQGLALYHAYHNEAAMVQFSRAERGLSRSQIGAQAERAATLATEMRPLLNVAQEALRQSMWPEEQTADRPQANYLSVPARSAGHEAVAADEPDVRLAFERPGRRTESADHPVVPQPISNMPGSLAEPSHGPVPGHFMLDDRFGWYVVAEKRSDFLPNVVAGSWVLVDRELEDRPPAGHEYVVVGGRESGLGSIIVQPVSQSSAVANCYLGYRTTTESQAGTPENSQVFLDESAVPVSDAEVMVLAVVEGFWFGLNGQPPPIG